MSKQVSHSVKRPGRVMGDPDVEIPVAEDLATVPGIPLRQVDVSFYSRIDPLESQNVEKGADRDWVWTVYEDDVAEYIKGHDERMKPHIETALVSGEVEPTGAPKDREDLTDDIRRAARELGFGEVGFTRFDRRYVYESKRRWVKYPHGICLALEQDYDQTQSLPSLEAEYAHYGTYEIESEKAAKLADMIRSRGYHAQMHSPRDPSAAVIPMFVAAGLGQLGANGQLLVAPLWLQGTPDDYHHGRSRNVRRARRLRDPRLLPEVPGVREPLPGPGARAGAGLVARRGEEQADLRPLPAGHGQVRGMRGLHEGVPDTEIRYAGRHVPLRRYRRGAWQRHR